MKLYTVFLITLLIIGILAVSGCVTVPSGTTGDEGTSEGASGVPTSDSAGEDISDIPRYTGSVRTLQGDIPFTAEGNVFATYLTSASVDEVLDFYQTQLPANGWTIVDSGEISKMPTAEKEGKYTVIAITESIDYSGYTNINIISGPK